MADVPERLFRDDAGAALERAARLEQENQELRAELQRLRRPGEVPTLRTRPVSPPGTRAVFALALSSIFLGGFLVAAAHRAEPSGPRFHLPPPPPPSLMGAAVASPMAAAPAATSEVEDCETPFTYDAQGVKHYKLACIHPERAAR